jgi:autotransporter-associated beta strand protein
MNKIGPGTMVLTNSATFSGNTDIEGGVLALDVTGQIVNSVESSIHRKFFT